jgi:hypothetical protein
LLLSIRSHYAREHRFEIFSLPGRLDRRQVALRWVCGYGLYGQLDTAALEHEVRPAKCIGAAETHVAKHRKEIELKQSRLEGIGLKLQNKVAINVGKVCERILEFVSRWNGDAAIEQALEAQALVLLVDDRFKQFPRHLPNSLDRHTCQRQRSSGAGYYGAERTQLHPAKSLVFLAPVQPRGQAH